MMLYNTKIQNVHHACNTKIITHYKVSYAALYKVCMNLQENMPVLGNIHMNWLTWTVASGPVPSHSTVTFPETGSNSYCWSVKCWLHWVLSVYTLESQNRHNGKLILNHSTVFTSLLYPAAPVTESTAGADASVEMPKLYNIKLLY